MIVIRFCLSKIKVFISKINLFSASSAFCINILTTFVNKERDP